MASSPLPLLPSGARVSYGPPPPSQPSLQQTQAHERRSSRDDGSLPASPSSGFSPNSTHGTTPGHDAPTRKYSASNLSGFYAPSHLLPVGSSGGGLVGGPALSLRTEGLIGGGGGGSPILPPIPGGTVSNARPEEEVEIVEEGYDGEGTSSHGGGSGGGTTVPHSPSGSTHQTHHSTSSNGTYVVGGSGEQERDRERDQEREKGLGSIPESFSGGIRRDSTVGAAGGDATAVPVGFDEGVLKGLCELDCGMPLLLDRMKQSMASCRESSVFLKKRAIIEEEYARSMIKLARSSMDAYSLSEGKSGSYVQSWQSLLRTHEQVGDNRLKFAGRLSDMSDELSLLGKEVERVRKGTKDHGARLERALAEQETLVDKAKIRLDTANEELERVLMLKQGELPTPSSSSHLPPSNSSLSSLNAPNPKRTFGKAMSKLKGPKSVAQLVKAEEEAHSRLGQSNEAYRAQVLGAQGVRQEYFNSQLPRILRSLKESVDECDLGTQYHLARYAFLFESTLVADGLTLAPLHSDDGPGVKQLVEGIDNREDFKAFMTQYALAWQMSGQRGPRRDGPSEGRNYTQNTRPPPVAQSSSTNSAQYSPTPSRPTFGIDLGEQMNRDGVEVPRVLEKCCEAIELHGLDSMGIYRISGTTSRVQRLKAKLDRDVEGVDLLSEENLSDINDISAVLKLWFREMPEPLLTWELYHGFIEAAKIENDRLRHIRLHERVNDLPDPNYATLKYLMGHLDLVRQNESLNQMSSSNLAIVFGPNLLGPKGGAEVEGNGLKDMGWQCKCVETILVHYSEIFVDLEG